MKPISIQIVAAQQGFITVINLGDYKNIELGEPVIAWRIETYSIVDSDNVFSITTPITVDGDAVSNCIGVQNPDNTVTVFEDSTYSSLKELQACYSSKENA
jgi:hypothetical protein